MSAERTANLIRMINQIAANLAARGKEVAVAETAEHIRMFWDPAMRSTILTTDRSALSEIARDAVERLARAQQEETS